MSTFDLTKKTITSLKSFNEKKQQWVAVVNGYIYAHNSHGIMGVETSLPNCILNIKELLKHAVVLRRNKTAAKIVNGALVCGSVTFTKPTEKEEENVDQIFSLAKIMDSENNMVKVTSFDGLKIKGISKVTSEDFLRKQMQYVMFTSQGRFATDAHLAYFDQQTKVDFGNTFGIHREVCKKLEKCNYNALLCSLCEKEVYSYTHGKYNYIKLEGQKHIFFLRNIFAVDNDTVYPDILRIIPSEYSDYSEFKNKIYLDISEYEKVEYATTNASPQSWLKPIVFDDSRLSSFDDKGNRTSEQSVQTEFEDGFQIKFNGGFLLKIMNIESYLDSPKDLKEKTGFITGDEDSLVVVECTEPKKTGIINRRFLIMPMN